MQKLRLCTMDEQGRVFIPEAFRNHMGWSIDSKLTVLISEAERSITLLTKEDGEVQLDEQGRVQFSEGSRILLEWHEQDEMEIALDQDKLHVWKFAEEDIA
ncbi:MAG: hypothetical protein FWE05_07675 [Defluviitaleaceae bacterium]|nr:hypothetical protein [Defluviitaleaceae bacterium]